ncbi:MAG: ImmA/IrrE family metallo-endopeptidase [Clostridiales bacterium]|jgi:Zn-dependent peptidase ImmA (M78 family)|nr:ImmA/IrrE family metallo-endopeptidase [Clostridiales bacterium]
MASYFEKYHGAFLASQRFLLNCKVEFPIDIHDIIMNQSNILLMASSEYECWCDAFNKKQVLKIGDGKCFYYSKADKYIIVYNDNNNFLRIRFTLAHELGHIALQHLNNNMAELSKGGLPDYLYYKMEGEANTFAGNLLAPPILIHKHLDFFPIINNSLIHDSFEVSLQAAGRRLEDYLAWKEFKASKYEEVILKKYNTLLNNILFEYSQFS